MFAKEEEVGEGGFLVHGRLSNRIIMIIIKVTFLTVYWQEKNEDVYYHWQSPGQRDIIREMFYF